METNPFQKEADDKIRKTLRKIRKEVHCSSGYGDSSDEERKIKKKIKTEEILTYCSEDTDDYLPNEEWEMEKKTKQNVTCCSEGSDDDLPNEDEEPCDLKRDESSEIDSSDEYAKECQFPDFPSFIEENIREYSVNVEKGKTFTFLESLREDTPEIDSNDKKDDLNVKVEQTSNASETEKMADKPFMEADIPNFAKFIQDLTGKIEAQFFGNSSEKTEPDEENHVFPETNDNDSSDGEILYPDLHHEEIDAIPEKLKRLTYKIGTKYRQFVSQKVKNIYWNEKDWRKVLHDGETLFLTIPQRNPTYYFRAKYENGCYIMKFLPKKIVMSLEDIFHMFNLNLEDIHVLRYEMEKQTVDLVDLKTVMKKFQTA